MNVVYRFHKFLKGYYLPSTLCLSDLEEAEHKKF